MSQVCPTSIDATNARSKEGSIPMEVQIEGKIAAAKSIESGHITRIATPAPDPYSHPGVYEVLSTSQLGALGEQVKVRCSVNSFLGKEYRTEDRRTGEISYRRNAIVQFRVLDGAPGLAARAA